MRRGPKLCSVVYPNPEWIRDPGCLESQHPDPGSDEQTGSYFLELRNHFFCFLGDKILKFFDADPGWRQLGSGMEKSLGLSKLQIMILKN
jgi:hypothetical protein